MEDTRASNGMRIKFFKQDTLMVSTKIYSDGARQVRVYVDPVKMEYRFVDPITGFVYETGGNVNNYEVLLRKTKRQLKKFLKIHFEKETRTKRLNVSAEQK